MKKQDKYKYLIFIVLFLLLIIITASIFGYKKSFVENVFVGLHGVFIEIFLIVIIFESIQRKINQDQINKVTDVLRPKIIAVLNEYKFVIEMIGQDDTSSQLVWENLSKVDFIKKPNVEPFLGNIADFIKWSIERNENKINNILYKYSKILELPLLKNLEALIDHSFSFELKFIPDVITMNKEGYIKHYNEFRYFSLMPDQKKIPFNKSFEEFVNLLSDVRKLISVNSVKEPRHNKK